MSLSLTLDGQPVTGYSNLRIKSVAPGGFASVTFDLNRSLDKKLLATFTDCLVYDTATGEQVGGGRLMEQGRGDDGKWAITCLGEGLASMQDRNEPYFLVDSTNDHWYMRNRTSKRLKAGQGAAPNVPDDDGGTLLMETTEGAGINTSASVDLVNPLPGLCGQELGGFAYEHASGVTDGDLRVRGVVYGSNFASPVEVYNDGWDTDPSPRRVRTAPAHFSGKAVAGLRWFAFNSIASASVTDDHWSSAYFTRIWARPYGASGSLLAHTTETFTLGEAFTDLLVRFCPRLDVATASIAATTHPFDQLAWLSGISPMGVMDEMLGVDTGFSWMVWEKQDNGKWRVELAPKPFGSEPRYEASVDDGFSAPSPSIEQYNRAVVTWQTPGGRDRVTRRTSVVPDLDDAGVVRSMTVPLGNEQGSEQNAQAAGDGFLDEHKVAPNAGTLTVSRATKVFDRKTGRYVAPWHIRPNELVRVRGVQPTPDTLNATSPDGVTVFRIVSNEYSEDDASSRLELDDFELTPERAVAQLRRMRIISSGPARVAQSVTTKKG